MGIRDDNGNVLISKNPISKNSETTEICLPAGKYIFNIYDAMGNGFQRYDDYYYPDDENPKDEMAGGYRLIIDDNVIKEGANFDYLDTTSFTIITPSSNPTFSNKPSISISK